MPVRSFSSRRRSTAAAIALTASLTAGASLLLSACGPNDPHADGSSPTASNSGTAQASSGSTAGNSVTGSGTAKGKGSGGNGASADPAASSAAPKLNGTAHNGLTISDGSRYVVMNGTRVDFGTAVRDLAWSPDGKKAAFVDGDGDLAVANPDGSGRMIVARNPGNQNWSHPTWQVRPSDSQYSERALNNILFAARSSDGVSKLYGVPATATNGTPKVLSLNHESGEDAKPLPQTGNVWPSGSGKYGDAVYANSGDGQVYIRDDYLRQQGSAVAPGSQPAIDPADDEGGAIVFVRSVGGHDHLFLERGTDSGPVYKDLTPKATTDYTEPIFSPGGTVIAARTPAGIVTLPADGSHAPVKVSDYQGLPGFRKS